MIAILSNTYAVLEPKSKALYSLEIARLNNTRQWDKDYGALISAPPLFDLLLIPFIPFYLIMKKPRRMNEILYYLEYSVILIPQIFIFTVLDHVNAVIAYFLRYHLQIRQPLLPSQVLAKVNCARLDWFYLFWTPAAVLPHLGADPRHYKVLAGAKPPQERKASDAQDIPPYLSLPAQLRGRASQKRNKAL